MKYEPNQWSLDIETLATDERAVILSVGLARFDPETNTIDVIQDVVLSSVEQRDENGRTIDPATVEWWEGQSEEARSVIKASEEMDEDNNAALHFIKEQLGPDPVVWGNGSDFDNVILRTLYRDHGMAVPWRYKKNRCMRTLCALEPAILGRLTQAQLEWLGPEVEREGVHHDAAADAVYQAKVIMRLLRAMRLT